jgi:hypothetical protein
MHAHPHRDSWATFLRLSYARAKSEFLTLPNWDQPAKGDYPDRKHWPSRIVGGWAWSLQPHPGRKLLSRKLKKQQLAGVWRKLLKKVKASLCLIMHHAMKAYGGVEV